MAAGSFLYITRSLPENVFLIKGTYHGEVGVGGVQLHVHHTVDGSLAVAVEVLAHLGIHFSGLVVLGGAKKSVMQ